MRYDPDSLTLRFASRDELDRFHRDLGDLLRRAVTEGATPDEDPVVGATRARDAMKAFATVTRALNAIRGPLREDEGDAR